MTIRKFTITGFLSALFLFSFPSFVSASVRCASLWANGFPDRDHMHGDQECHEFLPSSATLPPNFSQYLVGEIGTQVGVKDRMEWAAQSLSYAFSKYSSLGSVPKTTLVFYDRPYFGGSAGSMTPAFTFIEFYSQGIESCPILIYPDSLFFSKEHFQQIIAHELFHCVQKANFPAQSGAAVRAGGALWWYEGVAQFFSNWVYPSHDFEYHSMFGTLDPLIPFFDSASPYLTEHFFQSYYGFRGQSAESLFAMQSSMPSSPASTLEAALAIPQISEGMHQYARELGFHELYDSSGALAPLNIPKQELVVSTARSSQLTLNVNAFSAQPWEIILPKRSEFRIQTSRPAGMKLSARKAGDATWSDSIPTLVKTDCSVDRKIEGIFTQTENDLQPKQVVLNIQRKDNPDCPCNVEAKPYDACLFGTWFVEPASMKDFLRRVWPGIQPTGMSGTLKVVFTSDGNYTWDYQNLFLSGQVPRPRKPPFDYELTANGETRGRYSDLFSDPETQVCAKIESGVISGTARMGVGGKWTNLPVAPAAPTGTGSYDYTCFENKFIYRAVVGVAPDGSVMRADLVFKSSR